MRIAIRCADPTDISTIRQILLEAERWLETKSEPLWQEGEISVGSVTRDIEDGLFFVAQSARETVGTIKFQLTDELFWPDIGHEDSAFIHRLAVRRSHAGGKVSTALLRWSVGRTRTLGRRYLRLDCDTSRPKLRTVYERFGFQWHSDRKVGPYFVARYEYRVDLPPQDS